MLEWSQKTFELCILMRHFGSFYLRYAGQQVVK